MHVDLVDLALDVVADEQLAVAVVVALEGLDLARADDAEEAAGIAGAADVIGGRDAPGAKEDAAGIGTGVLRDVRVPGDDATAGLMLPTIPSRVANEGSAAIAWSMVKLCPIWFGGPIW